MAKLVLSSVVYVCLLYASCNREMQGEVGDKTSHKVQFIQVQPGVKLEVLDYGGSGRAMVFLAALGQNAHDWDRFAPKFVSRYHVYAITRRGFGNSDKPKPTDENYESNRSGDDVLAVMSALYLDRPVLVVFQLAVRS